MFLLASTTLYGWVTAADHRHFNVYYYVIAEEKRTTETIPSPAKPNDQGRFSFAASFALAKFTTTRPTGKPYLKTVAVLPRLRG